MFGRRYCALWLEPDSRYQCEVFEAPGLQGVSRMDLPSDVVVRDQRAEFYSIGRSLSPQIFEGDRRLKLKNAVGIWTDGLMVTTTDGALQADVAYRVVIAKQALPQP